VRSRARLSALALVAALAGCASPPVRFADRAILWIDPDDLPIAQPPPRPPMGNGRFWVGANDAIFEPGERFFNVEYGVEAANVNAVDEVPDSTWWTDPRRDPAHPSAPLRALAADELTRAAGDGTTPEPPFRITAGLAGGSTAGFVAVDARGRKWALKFDPENHVGLVTGADAIASRLAWASGWRVPDDLIIEVSRSDLILAPDAKMPNRWGQKEHLDAGDVDSILWHCAREADGRYRVGASRWIAGKVLGPISWLGRDKHDPNDRVAHEDRRDLRGFGVWASWVDDVDIIENNTLDSYVGKPGQGHVVHYQLDVGGAFGTFSDTVAPFWMGDQSYFQADRIFAALFTLGFSRYRWDDPRWQERRRAIIAEYPEIGGFDGEHFDPRAWRPIVDVPPIVRMTARDRYWAAKHVAAFSRGEIAAVVATAHHRPAAATFLEQALWQRRERIARDAFSESAPLDHFAVDGARLCFVDLWLRSGLGGEAGTVWRAREEGRVLGFVHGAGSDGGVCMTLPPRDGYRVVVLDAARPGERHFGPTVAVHLMVQGGRARVIGVAR
jgi:hypothetical protein